MKCRNLFFGGKYFNKSSDENITKTRLFINILKILPPKNENFQKKKSDIFHISAQNKL